LVQSISIARHARAASPSSAAFPAFVQIQLNVVDGSFDPGCLTLVRIHVGRIDLQLPVYRRVEGFMLFHLVQQGHQLLQEEPRCNTDVAAKVPGNGRRQGQDGPV